MHFVHTIPEEELPSSFFNIRGSSCGIPYPSPSQEGSTVVTEYRFLVHWVHRSAKSSTPPVYIHSIVRLDATTMKPLGQARSFSFDHCGIEFSCGMILDSSDKTAVVTYSVDDTNPTEVSIPTAWILAQS